jgi:hypothetical protein
MIMTKSLLFKSVEIIEKSAPRKRYLAICQKFSRVSSVEEEIFLNCFEISVKFCVVLIPTSKFGKKKVFRSY